MIPNTDLPKVPAIAVYKALITQTGTAAPVPIVLQNTTGKLPIWTRISAGQYKVTLTEGDEIKPALNKVLVILPNNSTPTTQIMSQSTEDGTTDTLDYVLVTTKTYTDVFTDGLLVNNTFVMEIYKP